MDTSPSENFMQKFIKSAPKSGPSKHSKTGGKESRLVKALKGKKK